MAREDLFITTKIWLSNYGYEKTKQSVKSSLEKLKVNYIDLVLLHQPFGDVYSQFFDHDDPKTADFLKNLLKNEKFDT
ncbi:hypothetical protein EFL98_11225 [Lactococcus lactis]|nr:hypothetical protein [Lactococcus lactis]